MREAGCKLPSQSVSGGSRTRHFLYLLSKLRFLAMRMKSIEVVKAHHWSEATKNSKDPDAAPGYATAKADDYRC